VVNLTIKGAVVGRGGDGGLPHLAFGAWSTDPDYNFTKTRRDGFQGATKRCSSSTGNTLNSIR
jgi:hypothetical protein